MDIRDDASLRALKGIRWLIITVIYGAFGIVMFPIAIYTLPDLEAAWFPPLTDQRISDVHRKPDDPRYLLWLWSFIKQRRAQPEYITFMAYDAENPHARYNVDTYLGWDCQENFRSDRSSEPSTKRVERQVCVKLPNALMNAKYVKVDGVFDFRVGHDFYTVPVKVPAENATGIPAPIADPK